MIQDSLANFRKYLPLNPRFAAAADFLEHTDLKSLTPGKHEILPNGEMYANVAEIDGHEQGEIPTEFHRKYIDIQLPLSAPEMMGWTPLAKVPATIVYDEAKEAGMDIIPVDNWVTVNPGEFVIFFPSDAHAPGCADGKVKKIIVKVLA